MGRYDTMIKCTQVRKLLEENKYMKALEIIKDMDIQKIHSVSDLNIFARVYIKADMLSEAHNIYLDMYREQKTRQILYRLLMLTIRMGNIEEAEEYYNEYRELDSDGIEHLILQYRLAKAKGVPRSVRISILEELKSNEFREEWGYQLAKLYDKEGMTDKCVSLCNEIVLWFGEGEYVDKAKRLRAKNLGEPYEEVYQGKMQFAEHKVEEQIPPPAPIPEPVAEPVVEASPEIEPIPEPEAEPVVEASPEIEPIPEPEAEPVVEASPEIEPAAEPVIEPAEPDEPDELEEPDEPEDIPIFILPEEKALKFCRLKQGLWHLRRKNRAVNFVLAGSDEALLITVSKKIAKEVKALGILNTSNIARINADRLNKINILDKLPKLIGNCVLIQDAPILTPESISCIEDIIQVYQTKIIFILTGEEDEMNLWLKSNMAIAQRTGIKILL